MKQLILSGLLFGFSLYSSAQVGGRGVYSFLNLQPTPRLAGLGGAPLSFTDADVGSAFYMPSLLNKEHDNNLSLNYLNYFSDINIGNITYAKHFDSIGTLSVGMLYVNYGKFALTDETGEKQGTFTAGDYNLQFGYGNNFKRFHYGANLKLIFSQLESYNSAGLALDLAGTYINDSNLLTVGVLMRNLGVQLYSYDGTREKLPFEIQVNFSKKLKHAPFRFIVVAHNIQTPDISYINPELQQSNLNFNEEEDDKPQVSTLDKIGRHFIVGTELVLGKGFQLRLGYNHQRRQEMTWDEAKKFAGFAWGVTVKIRRLNFSYANASFFPGKSCNQFSLTLNFNEYKKR